MTSKIDPKVLSERYRLAVVEQLGLVATVDAANDVVFKHPDLGTFYFSLDKDDPEYLMLVFPNFVDKSATNGDCMKLLEIINKVNRKSKGVKLTMRDDADCNVMATAESFVAAPDDGPSQDFLDATIRRTLSAVRSCVGSVIEEIKELKESSVDGSKASSSGDSKSTSSI